MWIESIYCADITGLKLWYFVFEYVVMHLSNISNIYNGKIFVIFKTEEEVFQVFYES